MLSRSKKKPPQSSPLDQAAWLQVVAIVGKKFVEQSQGDKVSAFKQLVLGASIHGREANAPVRETLGLLGDRWSTLLLQLLHYGPFRFSALQRLVGAIIDAGISRRMLAHKLRALERDGFVSRTVTPSSPPQVEYALTDMGEELWALAAKLVDWLTAQEKHIEAARAIFSQRERKEPLD